MENEKEKSFYKYLKKSWLNKNPKIYNYYDIICEDNEYNNKILTHFYATNNVAESIHAKISKYLPTNKINNNDFLYCIKNILIINKIKLNKIKSKDYIARYLRKISLNIKNENFNWISYEYFKRLQKEIIAIDNDIVEDKTLSAMNEIDLDKESYEDENNKKNNEVEEKESNDMKNLKMK